MKMFLKKNIMLLLRMVFILRNNQNIAKTALLIKDILQINYNSKNDWNNKM